jgi:hypothetical protein
MPKGRTGVIPGKKNFTSVGGVGAKRAPAQNSINSKALAPTSNIASIGIASILSPTAPPPPIIPTAVIAAIETAKNPLTTPTPTSSPILFDLDSITKQLFNFRGDGNPYLPNAIGPHEPIPDKYLNGMVRAVKRWSKFLAFKPETANKIREIFGTKLWNGLKLCNFKFVYVEVSTVIMQCTPLIKKNTCFNFGYALTVNTFYTEKKWGLSETQLFHLYTHELGHALGMPMFTPNLKNGTGEAVLKTIRNLMLNTEFYPQYIEKVNDDVGSGGPIYTQEDGFLNAVGAYMGYGGITTAKGGITTTWEVPLEIDKYSHWSIYTFTETHHKPYNNKYRGVHNEIMSSGWDRHVDSTSQYLISRLTIGLLIDIFTNWDDIKYYNYYELTPDSSEVTGKSSGIDDTIVFEGSIDDSKQIKNASNKNTAIPNDSKCIIHDCGCKPIFITDLSELKYCV